MECRAAIKGRGGLAQNERRPRHRLDTTSNCQLSAAHTDRIRCVADGVHSGAAQTVHGRARNRHRQSAQEHRHPGHVAVVFTSLVGTAKNDIVYQRGIEIGLPLEQGRDRQRCQVIGAHAGQAAAITANRGSYRIANPCISHVAFLVVRAFFEAPSSIQRLVSAAAAISRPVRTSTRTLRRALHRQ